MPRFSSQRTRQALLILGETLDPEALTETLELFDSEGNPIDITNPEVVGTIPVGGSNGQILTKVSDNDYDVAWVDPPVPPPSGMVWKGDWNPALAYAVNDVVRYDDGSGMHTYMFTEASAAQPPGDAPLPPFSENFNPITDYWDPDNTSMAVTLDETSLVSDQVHNANSPYVAVGFKTLTSGTIQSLTAPQDGQYRDLIANFYRRAGGGTSWTFVQQNDDSSGLGHPRISTNQGSNYFLFVLSTTDGADPTTQYGTSLITIGPGNTASYGKFHFGDPAFPIDSVIQIA
jgi:hypothetical protein